MPSWLPLLPQPCLPLRLQTLHPHGLAQRSSRGLRGAGHLVSWCRGYAAVDHLLLPLLYSPRKMPQACNSGRKSRPCKRA